MTVRVVHGPSIDEPVLYEGAITSQSKFIHADGLGSVLHMTGPLGSVIESFSYDVWGNVTGMPPLLYGFTGREWDSTAAMYYFRARWYDAKMGVFVSDDPSRFHGGSTVRTYVGGRPADGFDPSGRRVIHSGVSVGTPRLNLTKTCAGTTSGAATCVDPSSTFLTYPCEQRAGCKWGFNLFVHWNVVQDFVDDPTAMSMESPGRTLKQHEDGHLEDFREALDTDRLDREISTEGFATRNECEIARSKEVLLQTLSRYVLRLLAESTGARDIPPPFPPIPFPIR